jgi:acyl-CoA thioesterase FadM
MAAKIERDVRAGDPLAVVAWPIALADRRLVAGTAIYGADGAVCAVARSTWVLTRQSLAGG